MVLVNTRISDKSFRGYRRFRFFFAPILGAFDKICTQSELDQQRIEEIAPALKGHVITCGNIKFDQTPPEGPGFDYMSVFGQNCGPVVLASSTHAPEEKLILDTFLKLRKEFPSAKLTIVPRHAERGGEIEDMLKSKQLVYHRRSRGGAVPEHLDVLLADTTGELGRFIKSADLVIQGKTLAGNDEGQNIIEPAQMGRAIICGPKLRNFRQALDILRKADGVCRIESDSDLENAMRDLLSDTSKRNELGMRAQNVMQKNRGALKNTLTVLEQIL